MKYGIFQRVSAAAVLVAGLSLQGFGLEVINKEKGLVLDQFSLNVDGRLQFFGVGQEVKDPVKDDGRVYLYLKQTRLRFHGDVDDVKYNMELAFGGEDALKSGQNAALNLLDFSFDMPVWRAVSLKVGQFKVPYSRERLTNDGQQLFADRSIDNLAWSVGEDVGGALHAQGDKFVGVFGVFTGGGRDVPERYLPEKIGFPMTVLRVGYDDGIDKDVFDLDGTIGQADRVKKAVYLNGLVMKDTAIGHSVVLGLKTTEVPLLLDKNWNPYLGQAPLDRGTLTQAGGDAVIKAPFGGATVMAEAEANYAAFTNVYGRIEMSGGTATLGASKGKVEVAARYTYLLLDKNVTPGSGKKIMTGGRDIQEINPSLTYHIVRGRSKLIFDFPVLFNVPVATEKGVGSYVLTEQPDQDVVVNTVPGSSIHARTVVEARMIYQLSF